MVALPFRRPPDQPDLGGGTCAGNGVAATVDRRISDRPVRSMLSEIDGRRQPSLRSVREAHLAALRRRQRLDDRKAKAGAAACAIA